MKWITTLLLLLWSASAWAAGPIHIDSEKMRMDPKSNEVIFSGGVHLTRDDFDLRCDELTILYEGHALQRAYATGRVRMAQGEKRGASDTALFEKKKNTVTLVGHASVEDAQGVVRGDTIIHNITTQKSEVLQKKGERVHLTIDSDASATGVKKP